jgi:hypothetical protein
MDSLNELAWDGVMDAHGIRCVRVLSIGLVEPPVSHLLHRVDSIA